MAAPTPSTVSVRLDVPAVGLPVEPGGEIVVRGAYHSSYDGSIVDAATTTWPPDAPGGASIDAAGLFDFEAGGFHVVARDPVKHEVHAVATGEPSQVCAALRVETPCLPLRAQKQAVSRLITAGDWMSSLRGGITVRVLSPPAYAPPPAAVPYLAVAGGLLVAALGAVFAARRWKRREASAHGQLARLVERVQGKLGQADPVLAALLAPAVATARRSLHRRRIDAGSAEGRRVAAAVLCVEARLDASARAVRSADEQQAADELVREMESALEAADETTLAALPQRT
jgi:hypothetical protein